MKKTKGLVIIAIIIIVGMVFADYKQSECNAPAEIYDVSLVQSGIVDEAIKLEDDVTVSGQELESAFVETENEIEFSGRWFDKEIEGKKVKVTLNEGAMLYFKVEGTKEISLKFVQISKLETPYFVCIIDDKSVIRQRITSPQIVLPDDKEHTIQIVIDGINEREDKWYNENGVAFAGVETYGGNVYGIKPNKKRIVFVGDSITEGIMSLSDNAISDYNSATHSFPWYTGKILDAEPYFIGFGGTGIINKGSFYTNTVAWDFYSISRSIPVEDYPTCDLVVVNTGTNDFGVETDIFVEGYRELLKKIHNRYPTVEVVCMVPFSQLHANDIKQATQIYDWCHVVETEEWKFTYTDDGIHPDAEGSEYIADRLTNFIIDNVEW